MSIKEGVGYVALESSRRLGHQVPLYPAVTWGAASINTGGMAAQNVVTVL